MARRRFYVPADSVRGGIAVLPPEQAHHLRDVLRLSSGDAVEIIDGSGAGYSGEIELRGTDVVVRSLEPLPSEQPPSTRVVLAAALIKPARFEWILEKATELGVSEVIPLVTHFNEIKIPKERIEARLERWRRIIHESVKQCRRLGTPDLHAPREFCDFIREPAFASYLRILFYEKASEVWRAPDVLSSGVIVCIGPEGGWDSREIDQARSAGYEIAGLGPLTLRSETAAISALSIVQHQLQLRR